MPRPQWLLFFQRNFYLRPNSHRMPNDANTPHQMPNISTLPELLPVLPIQPEQVIKLLKHKTHEFAPLNDYIIIYMLTTMDGEVLNVGYTRFFTKRMYNIAHYPHTYIHALCYPEGMSEYRKILEFIEQVAISYFFPPLNKQPMHHCRYDREKLYQFKGVHILPTDKQRAVAADYIT